MRLQRWLVLVLVLLTVGTTCFFLLRQSPYFFTVGLCPIIENVTAASVSCPVVLCATPIRSNSESKEACNSSCNCSCPQPPPPPPPPLQPNCTCGKISDAPCGKIEESTKQPGPTPVQKVVNPAKNCFLYGGDEAKCSEHGCVYCNTDGTCRRSGVSCISCGLAAGDRGITTCSALPGCRFCACAGMCVEKWTWDIMCSAICNATSVRAPAPSSEPLVCPKPHIPPILWPRIGSNTGGTWVDVNVPMFEFRVFDKQSKLIDKAHLPQIISKALERYQYMTFPWSASKSKATFSRDALMGLNINLQGVLPEKSEFIQFGVDESYQLQFLQTESSKRAELKASTVWGILKGLETFSQVVECSDWQCCVPHFSISDSPRFGWRGLLLDSSRHFLPTHTVLHMLSAMSFQKFNVLHWHLSDGASFPLYTKSVPSLAEKGAYNLDQVYGPYEVKLIVEHANALGIRVVPELDMPAHTRAWSNAFPEYVDLCLDFLSSKGFECGADPHNWGYPRYSYDGFDSWCINTPALNPTVDALFETIKLVLSDVAAMFPDKFLHLGSDEVNHDCWLSHREWMASHGIPDTQGLFEYFLQKVHNIVVPLNRTMVSWEEGYQSWSNLGFSDVVIEPWITDERAKAAASKGFRILLGKTQWYINMAKQWTELLNYDPMSAYVNWAGKVLGAETMMWGEFVDEHNLFTKVWPMAAAAGDGLWIGSGNSPYPVSFSMFTNMCRMKRRGIGVSPIGAGSCGIPQVPF